jgi:hypothetical protein
MSSVYWTGSVSTGAAGETHSLPDWEKTLEDRPRLGYEFWRDYPRPLGFGLKVEVARSSIQEECLVIPVSSPLGNGNSPEGAVAGEPYYSPRVKPILEP